MKGELKDPRKTFGKAVSDIAENDERIYVLSADSGGSSGFKEFAAAHPDRYFEFGIMEQGVTGHCVRYGDDWKNSGVLCDCPVCYLPQLRDVP